MRRLLIPCLAIFAFPATARELPLTARTIDGQQFSLVESRTRVVIVNFWATWCAPCRAEMPALDRYYRAHHAEGLEMIAISLDRGATKARLARATANFAFPIARIDDAHLDRASIPTALPATLVYGRGGALRFASKTGEPVDGTVLEQVATPLIREPLAIP